MTNDQLNIAELQRLAEAATPGPWKFCRESWNVATPDCDTDICVYQPEEDTDMTGEFIAAASPQAVLSLIERIKELEKQLQQCTEQSGTWAAVAGKAHRKIEELEKQLADYVTKRDVAVSTLELVKEQRTVAQKALAEQCKETQRLEKQNAEMERQLARLKDPQHLVHRGNSISLNCKRSAIDLFVSRAIANKDTPNPTPEQIAEFRRLFDAATNQGGQQNG